MARTELPRTLTQTVADLQEEIRKRERHLSLGNTRLISTGCRALDETLPLQGVRAGSLIEWLNADGTHSSVALSLRVGREVVGTKHRAIFIDHRQVLHPLALASLGFDLTRVVIVRPATEREALWACEESLRCCGVRLVWASLDRLSSNSFRRLQLAAESSGCIGFLSRPAKARSQPSWADVRFQVHPCLSRTRSPIFQIEVASCHGKPRRMEAHIMLDSLTGTIHEVSTTISSTNTIPLPMVS
jgi:protein ImuA